MPSMEDALLRMPSHDDADVRYTRRSSADQRASCVPSHPLDWIAFSRPLASMLSRFITLPSARVATSTTSALAVGAMQTTGAANCAEPYDAPGAAEFQQPSQACHLGPALICCAPAEVRAARLKAAASALCFAELRIPVFLIVECYSRYVRPSVACTPDKSMRSNPEKERLSSAFAQTYRASALSATRGERDMSAPPIP